MPLSQQVHLKGGTISFICASVKKTGVETQWMKRNIIKPWLEELPHLSAFSKGLSLNLQPKRKENPKNNGFSSFMIHFCSLTLISKQTNISKAVFGRRKCKMKIGILGNPESK